MAYRSLDGAAITIATTETTLFEFEPGYGSRAMIQFANSGATAFNSFKVYARAGKANTTWATLFSVSGDYTAPAGVLVAAGSDPTVLAGAANSWLIMDVSGFEAIRLTATVGSGTTTATGYVSLTSSGR